MDLFTKANELLKKTQDVDRPGDRITFRYVVAKESSISPDSASR